MDLTKWIQSEARNGLKGGLVGLVWTQGQIWVDLQDLVHTQVSYRFLFGVGGGGGGDTPP